MHLDPAAVARLQAGDPETVAYFQAHLAHSCPACEEYLAGPDRRLDWLDAEVDRLLFIHAAPQPAAADPSGFQAVRRRLRKGRWIRAVAAGAGLALAASVALLVVRPSPPGDGGVKGGARMPALELSAVAVDADGRPTPLAPGGAVSASSSVLLRYRAVEPALAFLVVQGSGGPARALGQLSLVAGTADLSDAAGPAAVSMAGESGRVTLWLVRGARGPEDAAALVEQGGRPGASLSAFPVDVIH